MIRSRNRWGNLAFRGAALLFLFGALRPAAEAEEATTVRTRAAAEAPAGPATAPAAPARPGPETAAEVSSSPPAEPPPAGGPQPPPPLTAPEGSGASRPAGLPPIPAAEGQSQTTAAAAREEAASTAAQIRAALRGRPLREQKAALSRLERQVAQEGLRLHDLRRDRNRLERERNRLPGLLAAGRLSAGEVRRRLTTVLRQGDRYDALRIASLAALKEAMHELDRLSTSAAPAAARQQSAAVTRIVAQRTQRLQELCNLLLTLSEEAAAVSTLTGELSGLLLEAERTAPLRDLWYRAPFPLSRHLGKTVREARAALKPLSAGVRSGGLGLRPADLETEGPGGLGAVLAAFAVLVLACVWSRRHGPGGVASTPATRRQELAVVVTLHLAAVGLSYLTVQLLLLAFVTPLWHTVFVDAWFGWAVWYVARSLTPWLNLVHGDRGPQTGQGDRRDGPTGALLRVLLLTAAVQPVLHLARNAAGFPLEAVAVGELAFGLAVLGLLTPSAWRAWKTQRTASEPVRGLGWVVLFVVAAYGVFGVFLSGYQNLARYLAVTPPLLAGVVAAAGAMYVAAAHWTRELVSQPELETLEGWERTLESALRSGLAAVPTLAAAGVGLLAFPATNLRWRHVQQAVELLRRPLFAVQGSRFSLYSAVVAVLVVYLAWRVARFTRTRLQHASFMTRRYEDGVRYAVSTVVYYLLLVTGVAFGFLAAGLNLSVFTVFSATVGLAIGFGSQDIAKNFISGLILILDSSVGVGDYVAVAGQEGTIETINIRCTTLRTPDNRKVVVPNAVFVAQNVVGSPAGDRRMRVVLDFVVIGTADRQVVEETLLDVARRTPGVVADPPPEVWIAKLAAANITFQLAVWLTEPEQNRRLQGRLVSAAWQALQQQGITAA